MENLGDVLSHYRHDKFAVLLRELLDSHVSGGLLHAV